MKKIIKGKKYDTETAKELGSYSNGVGWRDFSHVSETLYQKRTGEYFLHGEGGPMTCYSRQIDSQNWSSGEKIIPMTEDEARDWAEKNLDADDFEELFGEVSEDDASGQIAELVKRSGLSQRAFAEQYHIPLRTLENWCNGDRTPPEYVPYLIQMTMDK